MKKLIFIFLLPLMLWSCSSQEDFLLENAEVALPSDYRSHEEIVNEATKAWAAFKTKSRAEECAVKKVTPVKNLASRNSAEPMLYAVEFEEEDGFVLVSSPTNVTPIIGYIESGSYSTSEISKVENFDFALKCANAFVETQAAIVTPEPGPGLPLMPYYRYDTITVINSKYYVSATFGEGGYAGTYCPNKLAGCGAVAVMHAMSYFQDYVTYDLTFPQAPQASVTPDWQMLITHKESDHILGHSCGISSNEHQNYGLIAREIGYRMSCTYKTNPLETKTSRDEFHDQARKFMRSHYVREIPNDSYLFDDLYKTTNIALVSATTADYTGNHIWVADGYLALESTITYYEKEVAQWSKSEITGKYVHHNWGNHGDYNGYIIDGIFDIDGERYEIWPPKKSRDPYVEFIYYSMYKK